jgi:hypothetical protein
MNGIAAQSVRSAPAESDTIGSRPLRNPKHEIYARERALMLTPRLAAAKAGLAPASGVVTRLERDQRVLDRIAFFTAQQEDLLRTKRARLEQFWWTALEADRGEFFETVEEVVRDEEGKPLLRQDGFAHTCKRRRMRNLEDISPELRRLIVVTRCQAPAKTEVGHHDLTLEGLVMQAVALREQRMRDEQAKAADQITA